MCKANNTFCKYYEDNYLDWLYSKSETKPVMSHTLIREKVFPEIKKSAKRVGATVYFQDESGIRSDFHSGKTWAVKGQTPVIEATGARFGLNMVGAISTRGQLRFMVVKGSVDSERICDFLEKLMHNAEKPVYLIWDGHPTHRSKKVKECIY